MKNERYEIEPVFWGRDRWFESEIGTLTGLPLEDILPVTSNISHWSGGTYRKVIQELGYNTNGRFMKFDKETRWPCLMRCKRHDDKSHWFGWVYHRGKIYCEGKEYQFSDFYRNLSGQEYFSWENKVYKITSMLQVWI